MPNIHSNKGTNQALNNAIAAIGQAEAQGLNPWIQAVNELRREVVLAVAQGGPLDPQTASAVKARIAQIMAAYQTKFVDLLSQNQRRLFTKGLQVVDKVVAGANLTLAIPHLSEATLTQAQAFGAELVTNLTDQARGEVAKQIDLAVLGQKPLEETLAGIGKNLSDPSIFATIAKRSEVIYRTEVNRMANLATRDRLIQAQKQVPDLMKRWVHGHVGIPRAGHILLDGETIPVDAKFKLRAADGKVYQVDGPHDPILPAGEVINCKCQAVPVVARQSKDPEVKAQGEKMLKKAGTVAPVNPAAIAPPPGIPPAKPKPIPPKPLTKEQKAAKEAAWKKKMQELDAAQGKASTIVGEDPGDIPIEATSTKQMKTKGKSPAAALPAETKPAAPKSPQEQAIDKLNSMQQYGEGDYATISGPAPEIPKEEIPAIVKKVGTIQDLSKVPKAKVEIKKLTSVHNDVIKGLVKGTIDGTEQWADVPLVVKHNGKTVIVTGHEQIAAAHLQGHDTVTAKVMDFDAVAPAAPAPKPKKAAAPPPAAPPAPVTQKSTGDREINVDAGGWKKIGGQAGSNPGGLYEAADGTQYYVKEAKSADHQANEIAAAKLYQAAGLDVPEVTKATIGGKQGVASKIVQKSKATAEQLAKASGATKGMAVDAWLGNWDVVGLETDNMVLSNGKALRLDTGGALKYRAQGAPKGQAFGAAVHEIDTLRMKVPGKPGNAQANAVFGKMTAQEIVDSIKLVEKVTPAQVRSIVNSHFGFNKEADALADTLLQRREHLLEKAAALEKTIKQYPEVMHQVPGAGLEVKLASGIPVKQVVVPKAYQQPDDWDQIRDEYSSLVPIKDASDPDLKKVGLDRYVKGMANSEIYKTRYAPLGLDHLEAAAIHGYSQNWYTGFNEALRTFTRDPAYRRAENLLNRALAKLPAIDTKRVPQVYRKEPAGWYNESITTPGQTVTFHGATSSSKDPHVWNGSVQYVITPKASGSIGRDISRLSAHSSEAEVLWPSGSRFKVLRVEAANGLKKIYVEEI